MTPSSACLLLAVLAGCAEPSEPRAGAIEVPSMLLRLIEQVDVPAHEAGVLASVNVVEGQMVEEGAVLAQIDDREARIAEERARIEYEMARVAATNTVRVRFARKSAEVAQAELRRSAESNKKYPKSISESEMDRLRLVVEKEKLEIEQAEYDTRVAAFNQQVKENDHRAGQQKVAQHKITAPLAGAVVQVYRHRGEWVKPGEAVVRVLRLDRLRAEGFLKIQQVSDELKGRPVRLWVDLPKSPHAEFSGKVVFLDPEIDPVNAQVRIWAEVENSGLRLRPGMRATMVLQPPGPSGQ
jgi:macrolide-specific efflux system membrane fusion protein